MTLFMSALPFLAAGFPLLGVLPVLSEANCLSTRTRAWLVAAAELERACCCCCGWHAPLLLSDV